MTPSQDCAYFQVQDTTLIGGQRKEDLALEIQAIEKYFWNTGAKLLH